MKSLQSLFEKIDSAHDDHDVPPEATVRVKEAVQEHLDAAKSEQLNSAIDDVLKEKAPDLASARVEIARLQGVMQEISDKLADGDANAANELAIANLGVKAAGEAAEPKKKKKA